VDAGLAAIVAGTVTGAVALLSPLASNEMSFRGQRRDAARRRYADYLAATYDAVMALGHLAHEQLGNKAAAERQFVWPRLDRVNTAITLIEMHDDPELREPAIALDRALVALMDRARESEFSRAEWRAERLAIIGGPLDDAKSAGRSVARTAERRWPR